MNHRFLLSIAALALLTADARANPGADPGTLHLVPEALDDFLRDGVFSSWNGGDPSVELRPGVKVLFYGEGQGCPAAGVQGGPVDAGEGPDQGASVRELTGLEAGAAGHRRQWRPSGNLAACAAEVRSRTADSFIHVNTDPQKGGVALYTRTGANPGEKPFFNAFTEKGQGGTGANKFIEGSFVSWRQAWGQPTALHPWRSADDEMRVRSVQSVGSFVVGHADARSDPAQAKQQIVISLINRQCQAESKGTKRLCQVQYLFNTAVYRAGVSDWSAVSWFRNATTFGDPAQGGMPVIHGPVDPAGTVTHDGGSGLPLYRSEGVPTQHERFSGRTFDLRVPFADFLNGLRMIVGQHSHQSADKVAPGDVAAEFGSGWNDPSKWVLLSADFAQEVYDASPSRVVSIGGSLRELGVGSAGAAK